MAIKDQVIISLFIVIYWVLVLICVMADCPLKQFVYTYTRTPEFVLSLEQSWRMFCPNPRVYSLHCYAIVTFKDGATAYYEFPRLEKMSQWDAMLRERLRKHFDDIMPWYEFRMFRPYIAQYVARGFFDPNNPPIQVSLCFNREDIPSLPDIKPRFPMPRHSQRQNYFVYKVRPEDFR